MDHSAKSRMSGIVQVLGEHVILEKRNSEGIVDSVLHGRIAKRDHFAVHDTVLEVLAMVILVADVL